MTRAEFVERFGGVYEHSPWVAERAFLAGGISEPLIARDVHDAMAAAFREAPAEQRLGVLTAHPDLAGKLAVAGELTPESTSEQASAGLDSLTPQEHERFSELNSGYVARFGFPFVIAVRGLDKKAILDAFERRIENSEEEEFATACNEVERIALLRLAALLPNQTPQGQ